MSSRMVLLSAMAAMTLVAGAAPAEVKRIDPVPGLDDDLDGVLDLLPRQARSTQASRYMPHQGKREMDRRRRRMKFA